MRCRHANAQTNFLPSEAELKEAIPNKVTTENQPDVSIEASLTSLSPSSASSSSSSASSSSSSVCPIIQFSSSVGDGYINDFPSSRLRPFDAKLKSKSKTAKLHSRFDRIEKETKRQRPFSLFEVERLVAYKTSSEKMTNVPRPVKRKVGLSRKISNLSLTTSSSPNSFKHSTHSKMTTHSNVFPSAFESPAFRPFLASFRRSSVLVFYFLCLLAFPLAASLPVASRRWIGVDVNKRTATSISSVSSLLSSFSSSSSSSSFEPLLSVAKSNLSDWSSNPGGRTINWKPDVGRRRNERSSEDEKILEEGGTRRGRGGGGGGGGGGDRNDGGNEGAKSQIFEGLKFLESYGYLPSFESQDGMRALMSDTSVRGAIKNMQKFGNVEETGELDQATLALMRSPRCGRPDVERRRSASAELVYEEGGTGLNRRRAKRFTVYGDVWRKKHLTYCFMKHSRRIYWADQESSVRRAFALWSQNSPFRFDMIRTQGCFGADIRIDFGGWNHGDIYPFDGPNRVLAHAFAPGEDVGGDIHFDDDESWVVGVNVDQSYEFFTVAVHEIGHSLGLGHSPVAEAIMTPYYKGYKEDLKLDSDDINGIQKRYGDTEDGNSIFDQRHTKTTTRKTTPTTWTTPTPPDDDVPETCDTNFDAASVVRFWEVFFFKGKYFWRVQKETMTYGPFKLATFWTQYPEESVDAVYEKPNGNLMFFKGQYFYEFDGVALVRGPLRLTVLGLPPQLEKIDAAFVWQFKTHTYFFAQKSYWKFDEVRGKMFYGYPKSVAEWRGVPAFPLDAVLQGTDDNIYFIQGRYYWVYSNQLKEVIDGPLTVSSQWTKCEGRDRIIPNKRLDDDDDETDESSSAHSLTLSSPVSFLQFYFFVFVLVKYNFYFN